jgi:WD40 repeat protein
MVDHPLLPDQINLLSDALRSSNPLEKLPADQQVLFTLRGVIYSLEQDGSPDAAELLTQASLISPYEEIQQLAVQALGRLAKNGSQPAIDHLFHLAIYSEKAAAIQAINANHFQCPDAPLQAVYDLLDGNPAQYQTHDPDYQLLTCFFLGEIPTDLSQRISLAAQIARMNNWVLIASSFQSFSLEASTRLVEQYAVFTGVEKQLLLHLLDEKTSEGSGIAGDTLCQLFIYQDEAAAAQLAVKNTFLPREQQLRALFLFLSERWDEYQKVDFNQALLSAAYETAAPALRKKLLDLSRYSGLTGWTNQLSDRSHLRWLAEMTDADWQTLILGLQSSQQFVDMWRLAQLAPPVWSAFLLNLLYKNNWTPPEDNDPAVWDTLTRAAATCLQNTPGIQLGEVIQLSSNNINTLALSADGSQAALGGAEASIQIINLANRKLSFTVQTPSAQIRAMAFEPEAKLIAAAAGDNHIHVIELSSGKKIKTLEGHTGHIRSLDIAPDGRLLYSASFDGTIRLWRFPQGPEVKRLAVNNTEWFSLSLGLHAETLLCAGANQKIQVWKLPEGVLLRELEGHTGTVTLLSVANTGSLAASYARDQDIYVWNYSSGKLLRQIAAGATITTALVIHPSEQFVISGNLKGEIYFWNISTGSQICQLVGHDKPIIGLAVTPDGKQLLSCSSDGSLCLWNLSTFLLVRLPIGAGKGDDLKLVEETFRQGGLSENEKQWLNFTRSLIQYHHRYDVVLDETHPIHIGEFDIEL